MSSGEIADLVEVADINWNRNIGRVAVVEEMLKADLDGNGADEFAKASFNSNRLKWSARGE